MTNDPKIYRTKDISELRQKTGLTGDEKIPVSKDTYMTVGQIVEMTEDDLSETLRDCVRKTDRLIVNGGSPEDLADNNI